uniref:Uncharacterized protein n=1 Tax=Aegilops tauschii subsp. strangulata TaxID=200361 RepID=A0A453RVX1_AEGTS
NLERMPLQNEFCIIVLFSGMQNFLFDSSAILGANLHNDFVMI